ncbi:MAG: aminotransferase, partial [Rhodospirillales bacterium]|nr:aminotransferase [Rhodospirillales bacterium]
LRLMALKIARRGAVPPFIVMDVMRAANARAAAGDDVIHLEVGQPATGAPEAVLRAAEAALRSDKLGYTEALGLTELRGRIAAHYRDRYGVTLDPARVVVTTGSSGAFLLTFLAAFEAGDRIALTSPSYPAYKNILQPLGIEIADIEVGAQTRFQPTVDLLDKAGSLDGLVVASPSNPTGSMLDAGAMKDLVAGCAARGIRLISDEIYHGITYDAPAVTALEFGDDMIVINSFSKYFSMTGWRLGWMVVPPDLVRSVECLAQNFFVAPPTLSQLAALAVFECRDVLDANVRSYARNRELLLDRLPRAGFRDIAPPDGAFYLYADVGHLTNDSADFCRRMLAETGVAATPGIDFDTTRGNRFIRFCYAGAFDDAAEAARRLETWLK